MSTIKILVGYHKPSPLLKSDILVPIHLGRALATEASKDGQMSQEEYQWMLDNMIGDDTSDNISHLNRYLNEMAGIYWAWKNYDQLGNPDYIGFMHYRRLLDFTNKSASLPISPLNLPYTYYISKNYIKKYGYAEKTLLKSINGADICHASLSKHDETVHEWFLKLEEWCQFEKGVFDNVFNAIDKNSYDVEEFLNSHEHYEYNCFVMKKDIFFKYCEFMFSLLLPPIKTLDFNSYSGQQSKRVLGFISERLTGMFVFQQRKNKTSFKQIPLIYIENTDLISPKNDISLVYLIKEWIKLVTHFYLYKILSKITFGKKRKTYKNKKSQLKFKIRQVKQFLKGK